MASTRNIATVPSHQTRWRRIVQLGWYGAAFLSVGVFIASIPGYVMLVPQGFSESQRYAFNSSPLVLTLNILAGMVSVGAALLSIYLAGVLFRRQSDERMAIFLSYYLLAYAILVLGPFRMLMAFLPRSLAQILPALSLFATLPASSFLFLLFPDGHFVPRWSRWLGPASFLLVPVILSTYPEFALNFLHSPPLMISVSGYTLTFIIFFSMLYAQVYRYRRVSSKQLRLQTKWVVYGIGVMLAILAVSAIPYTYSISLPPGAPYSMWGAVSSLMYYLSLAILPVSLTIAVMRFRLFEIDFLINRTLVYGVLTASVVVIYILLVGGLATLLQAEGNLLISLVATGLIAVLFQPLRERLQRAVNRLMYGERDEPFEALARLGRRLEGTFSPEMVYPTIVETVAQTLKLPFAAVTVRRGEGFETAEAFGNTNQQPLVYPLIHQGEVVGQLLVGRRTPNENFSPADERLLRSFAQQAGTAVYAVQLMADLQRSRQQLVTAREEERLRLRRDLHDGLGPALASVAWQADSARDLVYTDPSEAVHLLESSIEQAQAALADIRRLVYGLRPPALDELRLVGALEQAAQQHRQTTVTIETPAPLPPLPAAVEVAAYRIAQEALKNAVEHGRAEHCLVRLSLDGSLCLTVGDDGSGLPEAVSPGVGLISMRERAEELGGAFTIHRRPVGGTEVQVRLPLE